MFCFVLLSTFAGISPVLVAFFLIFGQVGLTFMQIALSNSISRALPKEQTGVGMGMLSLLNFISSSISAGIYSKAVDLGAAVRWNPANPFRDAIVYSNIYLVLAILHLGIFILYRVQFGRQRNQSSATARVKMDKTDHAGNIGGG
jgi:DHA2 family metal-tetracycline-proton antiporter-like MFS transporter